MAHAPIWKSRPVFITSTFQDMQAERDHLRNQVFPALEEWLKSKRRHLEWIDLRVGVASAKAEDESARELLVLKVCLDEVRRSRPFLIALIGDRYGWVPPKERIKAAATEAGFSAEEEDRSVTDLEIDFGVFHDKDQKRRSLFFLRAPLPYDKMQPEKAVEYSDGYANDQGAAKRWERLKALKTRIRTEYADRCFDYSAAWDEIGERVTGLEAWGRDVDAKIKQAIEDELAAEPEDAAEQTPDDIERDALADFAEDRARDFIGRKDTLGEIEALFKSPAEEGAPWGLCITGEAGSGKSALFGALYQGLTRVKKDEAERVSGEQRDFSARLGKLDALVLAHAAGASPRATSVDAMLRCWIEEFASFLKVDLGLPDKAGPNDVEAVFSSLLGRAALKQRVIVLVDALDQFEQTPQGRFATWLPRLWPANARFIATAIPGEASEALSKRPGIALKPIPALDASEARHIATTISARYHRELEAQVLDALIGDDKRWGNPLWLVLAVEELNLLDADDFARARQDYKDLARDDERIRALMCQMATRFPADVPGLYRRSFEHAVELFGAKLTQAFLGLIAVSRSGWRESDFREVLPKVSGEAWDELRFAQLRRSFRGQLRRRGDMEQWDFAHTQMRIAAKTWLIETKGAAEIALHTALGDHLLALPPDDPLHISESMLHLMEGEDWAKRSAEYCGSTTLSDAEVTGTTEVLTEIVLASPKNDAAAGARRIVRLLETSGLPSAAVGRVARRIIFDLNAEIGERATLDVKLVLAAAANTALSRLTATDSLDVDLLRDLSISFARVGEIRMAKGNLDEAQNAFRDGISIAVKIQHGDPANVRSKRDLSVLNEGIGDVFLAQGNLTKALQSFRDSYGTMEQLAQVDPGDDKWQHDLSISRLKIGDVLEERGLLSEALRAFRDSHAVLRRLVADRPDDAAKIHELLASSGRIGGLLKKQGNLPEALECFRDRLSIAERLARSDPGNPRWQRDLAVSHLTVGDVLEAQGCLPEALNAFRDSLAITKRLAQIDPGNTIWQKDIAVASERIGDVLAARGDLASALKSYKTKMTLVSSLVSADESDLDSRREISVAWNKIGEVLLAQGNLREALDAFREGLFIREHLASNDPEHIGYRCNLMASWVRVYDVLTAQGNRSEALKALHEAQAIADRLVCCKDETARLQRDISVLLERIGDARLAQGMPASAFKAFSDRHVIARQLAHLDTSNVLWQRDLATSHLKMGDVFAAQGNISEAYNAYEECSAIFERVVQIAQDNSDWQREYSISLDKFANMQKERGNLSGALKALSNSLEITKRLVATDPNHVEWQRDLSITWTKVGDVLIAQHNSADALEAYHKSLEIDEALSARDPNNLEWQRDISVAWNRIGEVLLGQGSRSEAMVAFVNALNIRERLAKADADNADSLRDLSASWSNVGDVLTELGYLAEAREMFLQSQAAFEQLLSSDDTHIRPRLDFGANCGKLGRVTAAIGDVGAASEFYTRALEQFKEVLKVCPGYPEAQRMTMLVTRDAARLSGGGALDRSTPQSGSEISSSSSLSPAISPQPAVHERDGEVAARKLLIAGDATTALRIVEKEGGHNLARRNLQGVCLLRLNRPQEALDIFHALLFPNNATVIADSASPHLIANYATAQLVCGDIRGARKTLDSVWDQETACIARLQAAIAKWEQSLSFAERTKWHFGGKPPKPIHLDPPYGEL